MFACRYGESQSVWAADFIKELNGSHHYAFYSTLFVYGILLGLTHTGASYLLGEAPKQIELIWQDTRFLLGEGEEIEPPPLGPFPPLDEVARKIPCRRVAI